MSELEAWILTKPEKVQKVIRALPPTTCYKGKNGKGHYRLYAYDEEKSGEVSIRVDHLDDSFLPGHRVFGKKPGDLTPCGCLVQTEGNS